MEKQAGRHGGGRWSREGGRRALHKPRLLQHILQKWNGSPVTVAPPTRLLRTHPPPHPRGLSHLILPHHASLGGHHHQMPSRTLTLHMLFPLLTMPCLNFFCQTGQCLSSL